MLLVAIPTFAEQLEPLYKTLSPTELDEKTFFKFCDQLYSVNRIVLYQKEVKVSCREAMDLEKLSRYDGESEKAELLVSENLQSGYLTITLANNPEKNLPKIFHVLFNGRAMFLGSSYNNRDWPEHAENNATKKGSLVRDYGLVIDNDGHASVVDQNKIFLQSLPQTVSMSRCMSKWEFGKWKSGKFDMNQYHGDRLHFGYGEFSFNEYKSNCVKVRLPRSVLEKLDRENLLEINTYEYAAEAAASKDPGGMSPASYCPFGIPFEIVILFKEGADQIKDYMKDSVKF